MVSVAEAFVRVAGTDPVVQGLVGGLVIAALNLLGASLVLVWRRPSERSLDSLLGFAAGAMLFVISDEIVPEDPHARPRARRHPRDDGRRRRHALPRRDAGMTGVSTFWLISVRSSRGPYSGVTERTRVPDRTRASGTGLIAPGTVSAFPTAASRRTDAPFWAGA